DCAPVTASNTFSITTNTANPIAAAPTSRPPTDQLRAGVVAVFFGELISYSLVAEDDSPCPDRPKHRSVKQLTTRSTSSPAQHRPPDQTQHHPVVLEQQAKRAHDFQLRIADWITAYAGSMPFVYVHIVVFAVWILFIEH